MSSIRCCTVVSVIALLTVSSVLCAEKNEKSWATPEPAGDVNSFGANIQRTMSRLASSTPDKRNHVRILFYGQSVTRNPWWQDVADDLGKRFPHADLEIENRAIGGYGGPVLINTAEFDLYPFYPDLVIFHVWGGVETGHQEKIIRRIRERTTADILLWTSNLRWPKTVPPDGDPQHPDVLALDAHDQAIWDLYQRLGDELHCEVADVRTGMQNYLTKHGLVVKDTLRDTVHPNELGNFLIAELVEPHLRHRPDLPVKESGNLVQDIPIGDERVKRNQDGSISLTFSGNRIDIIAAPVDGHGPDGTRGSTKSEGQADVRSLSRESSEPRTDGQSNVRVFRNPVCCDRQTSRRRHSQACRPNETSTRSRAIARCSTRRAPNL